ncbi:MAG: hypothetical protein J6J76_02615 [Paraprevotella sp.]|nr:hypothetical protein [Paraprevotella sp.]
MKEFLNRLIALHKSGEKMQETTLLKTNEENVTPEWIDTLQENEIFVFGCRNSGRHLDGASNFALKHFGAVMGQREGRQGQSYAIPTIGGTIGLNEIRKSVDIFTKYAAEHPELHFLVTPIGCGGGCCEVWEIAPMFRKASKLTNVSLPQEFWIELDKGYIAEVKQKLAVVCDALLDVVSEFFGELRFMRLKMMSPNRLYRELISRDCNTISLSEQMEWADFYDAAITGSWRAEYLINHSTKCAYMVLDNKKRVRWVKDIDIDWNGFQELPKDVQKRVCRRECKYTFGTIGEYKDGVTKIIWQISPDGRYYYLDKYYGGKTTNEKNIWLQGVIDTHCRFVEKLQILIKKD